MENQQEDYPSINTRATWKDILKNKYMQIAICLIVISAILGLFTPIIAPLVCNSIYNANGKNNTPFYSAMITVFIGLGFSSIAFCVSGVLMTIYGYRWFKEDLGKESVEETTKAKRQMRVVLFIGLPLIVVSIYYWIVGLIGVSFVVSDPVNGVTGFIDIPGLNACFFMLYGAIAILVIVAVFIIQAAKNLQNVLNPNRKPSFDDKIIGFLKTYVCCVRGRITEERDVIEEEEI